MYNPSKAASVEEVIKNYIKDENLEVQLILHKMFY